MAEIPGGQRVYSSNGGGRGEAVSSGPLDTRDVDASPEDEAAFNELEPSVHPQWERCGAVQCIDSGPWTKTLVCCTRRFGHEGEHRTALGDVGAPEYWEESWL